MGSQKPFIQQVALFWTDSNKGLLQAMKGAHAAQGKVEQVLYKH